MHQKGWPLLVILVLFFLTSCVAGTPSPVPVSPQATATQVEEGEPRILISEVLAGEEGNNNYDYIELYNTSPTTPVDLQGWTLWYQLEEGKDEIILHRWKEHALVPPQGHYLLGRAGEDFGLPADVFFDIPLATSKGGLLLRMPDDTRGDSLSWGGGPQRYGEGEQAAEMSRGVSLERKPGGDAGNMVDTDRNRDDFTLNPQPLPQNTGSRVTPIREGTLDVSLSAPDVVEPGAEYDYTFQVSNRTGRELRDLQGVIPLPVDVEILEMGAPVTLEDNRAVWAKESMAPGETSTAWVTVKAPMTYISTTVANVYVEAANWPAPAFGGPVRTDVAGGSIPVETARSLIGKEVAVEGIATMYTGGYYAGSGNTKFYVEDESGGVQVWVPGGQNEVDVRVGDRVRVQGEIQLYRGAVELVVHDLDAVKVKQRTAVEPPLDPEKVSIDRAASDESLAGKLVQVEGEVVRTEEFSYSYELDLIEDSAGTLTLYIDKNTEMTTETVEVGDRYQARGILEILDGRLQLYPRVENDLARVYPPALRLTLDCPITVQRGESFPCTLTAYNHTSQEMTDVEITLALPGRVSVKEVQDGGEQVNDKELRWAFEELPGNGGKVDGRFSLTALGGEYILLDQAQAQAREWKDPAQIDAHYVFQGDEVPIWAVQGPGFRSNYILDELTTTGVVTGVYPELGGFWIQEQEPDADPRTSEGLFINAPGMGLGLERGMLVRVTGTVREQYQQTQIMIDTRNDVEILKQQTTVPSAVALDPPLDDVESEMYFETLEGMMVQVSEPALVVGPTTRYGEFTVVLPEHQISRLWSAEDSGVGIIVDDGSYRSHDDRSSLEVVVGVGDKVADIVGPLAYTFGNYKVEPVQPPRVIDLEQRLPTLPRTAVDEFSIATWNVENLFDIHVPHPSDPDMPTVSEYDVDVAKVANTILSAGLPTVVGLQEVENIGVLEDIAAHSSLEGYQYQAALIEGTDSRGIDVGYLIRGDRARILDTEQFTAPEGLTSRPPLMAEVQLRGDGEPRTLYVINNHFTSMSGGVEATEPRRTAQAAWNVEVMEKIWEKDPGAYIAVIGDLNSFYLSPPLDTLRQGGLAHVLSTLPDEERYNYIYDGRSQLLDHILVTPSLMEHLVRVAVLHTNADFPLPAAEDVSPRGKSDHDLVIATFSLHE